MKQGKKKEVAKHIQFDHIDSTNTWAKNHLDQWDKEGITLITASHQTEGRGRFKRKWHSPPEGNIYATFCFWFDMQRQDIGQIPQLMALAAAQALEDLKFNITLKWPNDILIERKKVGGILCETVIDQGSRAVICGIGLNVNMSQEALNQIDRPATSLCVEGKRQFDPLMILKDLQHYFILFLGRFLEEGFTPFFAEFKKRSPLKKGEIVRFHDNQNIIEAEFLSLYPDGSIELLLPGRLKKRFYAGEFVT